MNVVIAGASGFIGNALVEALRTKGHVVHRLVRGDRAGPDSTPWHPGVSALDPQALEGADAVVNLSGENISSGRWTRARRGRLLASRINSTRTLVAALSAVGARNVALLNASAVGIYGDRGDEELSEASAPGHGFLADLCGAWEKEAEAAASIGVRTVRLRFGVVLGPAGGALGRMEPLFRAGLGGRLGTGRQWMSWVHLDDVVGAIEQALTDARYVGPLNVTAPHPVTNAEFTAVLADSLHRRAWLPAPAFALRLAFGRMADEALLASTRAIPARLLALGYPFLHPQLGPAMNAATRS